MVISATRTGVASPFASATIPLAVPVAFTGCSPKDAGLGDGGQHGHHRSATAEATTTAAAKATTATAAESSVAAGGRHLATGVD
jgi:hypothetical protein